MNAIILAGGKSERMKKNKALVMLDGKPIIAHVCDLLREMFEELILVTNSPRDYSFLGVKMVTDLIKGKGSLGGLYTGLFYATSTHALVVACDMPFLKKEVIGYLMKQASPRWDVIVPCISGGYEPLHAIYARRCLPYIQEHLLADELRITGFYPQVRVKAVDGSELSHLDPELRSWLNINTPEDLKKARVLFPEIVPEST